MTVYQMSHHLGISEPTVTQRARALLAEGKIRPREGRDWIFSEAETELMRDFVGRERVRKAYVWKPEQPPATPPKKSAGAYGSRPRRYADGAEDVPVGE